MLILANSRSKHFILDQFWQANLQIMKFLTSSQEATAFVKEATIRCWRQHQQRKLRRRRQKKRLLPLLSRRRLLLLWNSEKRGCVELKRRKPYHLLKEGRRIIWKKVVASLLLSFFQLCYDDDDGVPSMSAFETFYHKNFKCVLRTLDVFLLLQVNKNNSTGVCKRAS